MGIPGFSGTAFYDSPSGLRHDDLHLQAAGELSHDRQPGRGDFADVGGRHPYAIWMMKNFMDTVSVDLEEAAWIDGASRAQATIHVLIP